VPESGCYDIHFINFIAETINLLTFLYILLKVIEVGKNITTAGKALLTLIPLEWLWIPHE
jgi:hypothetical protein